MKKIVLLLATITIAAYANCQKKWLIDNAHSNVTFAIQWMQNSFRTGEFKVFSGDILLSKEETFEDAKITFSLTTSSIDLITSSLMGLAQNEEYLGTKKYPEIEFKSTSVKKKHKNVYELSGQLTIKGLSHEVTFNVEDNGIVDYEGQKYGALKVTGQINKSDFNIYGGDKRLGDIILITAYFETVVGL